MLHQRATTLNSIANQFPLPITCCSRFQDFLKSVIKKTPIVFGADLTYGKDLGEGVPKGSDCN